MFSFFSSLEKKPESNLPAVNLLIVVPKLRDEILSVFSGENLNDGRPLNVLHCTWSDFSVASDCSSGSLRVYVEISRGPSRGVHRVDFALIRSEVRGVTEDSDFRHSLYALIYGNVPSVNSLHSVYCFLERPIVQAELNRLNLQHGSDAFPLVHQSCFSHHRHMIYGDRFPAVVKVGRAPAGCGTMKVADHHVMDDVRSLLALGNSYISVEPLVTGDYDLRIQKIGQNFRAFKRVGLGTSSLKSNTDSSVLEEIPMNETYKFWITEASSIFGGLDICSLDAVHDSKSGREIIMELSGTSSGLFSEDMETDNAHIKQVVIDKMNALFCAAGDCG